MGRQKIVAGNWKMNKTVAEGKQLVSEIVSGLKAKGDSCTVIVAPPFLHLEGIVALAKDCNKLMVAAQNCHQEVSGAYTGEISAAMLQSAGVDAVILGHSERRQYYGEDEALLAKKIDAALAQGLKVIYCVGELLEARDQNLQNDVVKKQISGALYHLANLDNIILAYEPVWAIGTGRTATSEQAQDMHAFIRSLISEQYGADAAENISILYGGSCNAKNADELFAQPDVDGGLIGGASLNANDFGAIIDARSK